jgi:hypothetical protein
LCLGFKCKIRGDAVNRYAIEFRPSVNTFPTSKISPEYDFPLMLKRVEIMIFKMYKTPMKAIELISFLNFNPVSITKNETGRIKIQIVVDAKLDNE